MRLKRFTAFTIGAALLFLGSEFMTSTAYAEETESIEKYDGETNTVEENDIIVGEAARVVPAYDYLGWKYSWNGYMLPTRGGGLQIGMIDNYLVPTKKKIKRIESIYYCDNIRNDIDYSIKEFDANGNMTYSKQHSAEYEYVYDDEGNIIKSNTYDILNDWEFIGAYEYDDFGNVISYTVDSTDGENWLKGTIKYEYDNNNRIIKKNGFDYTYDDNGNVIVYGHIDEIYYEPMQTTYNVGTEYTYEYDDNGNIIGEKYYYSDTLFPSTSSCYTYQYDNEGRLTQRSSDYGAIFTYAYDERGNLSKYEEKYPNGTVSSYSYENEYDEDGDIIKSIKSQGTNVYDITYEYYEDETKKVEIPTDYFATYENNYFYKNADGNITCLDNNGNPVINDFKCDGTYTYYFQADGTAMKDRLTYHPDGEHVIYFDSEGHEVFSDFANVKKTIAGDEVDDYCFFNVFGYMYVDVVTYDKTGSVLYYANAYGVMEMGKWFQFSENVTWADGREGDEFKGGYGCANADGTLITNTQTIDWEGRSCYLQGNGVALY